jgi:hypothetical protein
MVAGTVTPMRAVKGDAAVTGEQWSAAYTQGPNSEDAGAGDRWPPSGQRSDRDVWTRMALKWDQYPNPGIAFQKIHRLWGSDGSLVGSFGLAPHDDGSAHFIWDFGMNGQQQWVANAPAPGTWHWYEFHFTYPSGGKPAVEIYMDGKSVYRQTSTLSGGPALGVYYFYGTLNGGNQRTVTFKYDDVAVGPSRLGLPAGAKIGVP